MMDYGYSAAASAFLMLAVAISSFVVSAAIVGILFWLIGRGLRWRREHAVALGQALFFGFPFSILGVTVGFVTSLSRESAVGAVLPAILSLVGGVGVYLVSKGGRMAITSAVSVVMLCVAFSAGVGYGSRARTENEQLALSPAALIAAANREANIKKYRKQIGLDDQPAPAADESDATQDKK